MDTHKDQVILERLSLLVDCNVGNKLSRGYFSFIWSVPIINDSSIALFELLAIKSGVGSNTRMNL